MSKPYSNERKKLLLELEAIVGNEFYNARIQNWGPNGVFEGEGRDFRYPITFIDKDAKKIKRKNPEFDLPEKVVRTGYYAVGQNELHIIRALCAMYVLFLSYLRLLRRKPRRTIAKLKTVAPRIGGPQ